ncbi:lipid II flippase MurJ [Kineococcus rhizosphaerae]|uniref:Putative peptidoglycan lipid II flippase n=1 Tax=Kineococcus rhizosphaerae TaxID=559628 RepID=A0A2T0QYH3_9ACTN|nr:lipid II flippase MurJ [Kineococcus rhizosphaerae]PRY11419.1 putative peptidoglycan lipid II flippase [Kineococcus rhizosphaerae]
MRQAVRRLVLGGLVGKLLGLLREVLLAAAYGTGAPVTATRVAQTATLSPVDLFTADVLTAGFLPLHRGLDPARAAVLFRGLRTALWALAAVLTVGLLAGARPVVGLVAPGLDPSTAASAALFLQLTALGIPSYLQFSLLSYLEMSHGGFTLSSVRATVQNAGLIASLAAAWLLHRPVLVATGFAAAYLGLHAWGHVSLRRRGLLPPVFHVEPGVGRELRHRLWVRLRPLLLLPVVLQSSVVLERVVASLLGEEVVAAVDYARFVATTGVNLLAVPLGLAGLAVLAGLDASAARARLAPVLPGLLLVVVPASVVLVVGAAPVVEVLYARGAFDARAVRTSAAVLAGFGVGFWAQSTAYVLVKALNAAGRNAVAALALVAGLLVTVAVNVGLHGVLGPVTLGLATSAGSVVTTVVAARALGVGGFLLRWTASCLPVAVVAGCAAHVVPWGGLPGCAAIGAVVLAVFAGACALVPGWRRVVRGLVSGREQLVGERA